MPATNMRPSGVRTGVWATGPTPDPLGQNPWDGAGHLHWGHVTPRQPTGRTSAAQRGEAPLPKAPQHAGRSGWPWALDPRPVAVLCPPPRPPPCAELSAPSLASLPSQARDPGCDWQMDRSLRCRGHLRHPAPPPRPGTEQRLGHLARLFLTGLPAVFFHPVIQQKPGPSIVSAHAGRWDPPTRLRLDSK